MRTAAPLPDPDIVYSGIAAIDSWRADAAASYILTVSDPATAAPAVTRALVAANADVLSISKIASLTRRRLPRARRRPRQWHVSSISTRWVRAIFHKELREYRYNGNIVYATVILPFVGRVAMDQSGRVRRDRLGGHG